MEECFPIIHNHSKKPSNLNHRHFLFILPIFQTPNIVPQSLHMCSKGTFIILILIFDIYMYTLEDKKA